MLPCPPPSRGQQASLAWTSLLSSAGRALDCNGLLFGYPKVGGSIPPAKNIVMVPSAVLGIMGAVLKYPNKIAHSVPNWPDI